MLQFEMNIINNLQYILYTKKELMNLQLQFIK